MKTVTLKNLTIGSGIPKICVPITGTSSESAEHIAAQIASGPADFAEWRIDYMKDLSVASLLHAAGRLRGVLGEKPLLATFRSSREGGEKPLSDPAYFQLYERLIERKLADAVDLEQTRPSRGRARLIDAVHRSGGKVIISSHDFSHTPSRNALVTKLKKMEAEKADIAKIAVMPRLPDDVLTLMEATLEASGSMTIPIITMAMGSLGKVSRISGMLTGSAVTFGSLNEVSAPGQIEVNRLKHILTELSPDPREGGAGY
ncbi:type I 3-dehydroquinate dehydratase [Sporolactobacillus sp. THM19-2]|uniref:type I 3-dehydroquinate dehydratase n=1 Tax=Sporolactobacillus sp. THM19-2 TaxID=2511171 RepID=UPI001021BFA3|nr:type I 3-dehydroquinate dehydratase [Sporolactobacillus sp. THM19-2]RYL88471.1 type I 3-dehydroquinate dehydratase [Sporolactobacillus sp. THM19-2]